MRIRVEDPIDRAALAGTLAGAGCLALTIGETIEVEHLEEQDRTGLELRFFLRAWQLANPRAAVELLG